MSPRITKSGKISSNGRPPTQVPTLSVTPTSLDFGTILIGQTKDLNFTVKNTSGGILSGTATAVAPYSIVAGSTFSLGKSQYQAVAVRFSPTSAATFSSTISIVTNVSTQTPAVTGVGSGSVGAITGSLSQTLTPVLLTALGTLPGSPPNPGFNAVAGPDKTIALPAKDVTLFGGTDDPSKGPFVFAWSQVSGPAVPTFSSSTGFTTTVTLSTAGTYVLRLSATTSMGTSTDDVTVTVLSAASQTAYYVDPNYAGSTRTGTASNPWQSLSDTQSNTPWTVIDTALASNNVIVYFSARAAGSDTNQTTTTKIDISRTNTSTYILTLDGMSKYNTNDSTPSWSDYSGSSRFQITASQAIGTNNDLSPYTHRSYITIRGIKTIGNGTAHLFFNNVSYFTYEYCEHSAITAGGPGVIVAHRPTSDPVSGNYGRDITIRNNYVHDTAGEGIYIGGSTPDPPGNGPIQTNVNVLIENNTVTDPGGVAEEGDGIDVKDGNVNLVIRGNVITYTNASLDAEFQGIVAESAALIENNVISGAPENAIKLPGAWSSNPVGRDGAIVRNNAIILSGLGRQGLLISSPLYTNVQVLNNTMSSTTTRLRGGMSSGAIFKNNIIAVFDNTLTGDGLLLAATGVVHSNNLFHRNGLTGLLVFDGATYYNSSTLPTWEPTSVFGNPVLVNNASNLRLQTTSPAKNVGATLSTLGFALDLEGIARPQGTAWDIGAYEFH